MDENNRKPKKLTDSESESEFSDSENRAVDILGMIRNRSVETNFEKKITIDEPPKDLSKLRSMLDSIRARDNLVENYRDQPIYKFGYDDGFSEGYSKGYSELLDVLMAVNILIKPYIDQ